MRILVVSEEKAMAGFETDCLTKEQIMMHKNAPQSICIRLFRTRAGVDFTLYDDADDDVPRLRFN